MSASRHGWHSGRRPDDIRPARTGSAIVEQVLAETVSWQDASAADVARVEAIARAVMQRMLREPTIRMKALEQGGGHGRLAVLRELFRPGRGAQEAAARAAAAG